MFKTIVFKHENEGKNILILGAVHGNETAGTKAQYEIIDEIKQGKHHLQSGLITFIPIVNEQAYQKDMRGIDDNLNRVIKFHENPKTNEEKIANQLIKEIEKALIKAELGVAPNNDGTCIRLNFPPLTEERRRETAKDVKNMAKMQKLL